MPGMMDTVLNIGLNDETAEGMIKLTGNARFVYDSYRRLVEMFGSVVLGIPDEAFEDPLAEYKAQKGLQARYRADRRRLESHHRDLQGSRQEGQGLRFPTGSVSSSCDWPPKPSSNPGTASAPSITATRPTSPTTWAPRSTS